MWSDEKINHVVLTQIWIFVLAMNGLKIGFFSWNTAPRQKTVSFECLKIQAKWNPSITVGDGPCVRLILYSAVRRQDNLHRDLWSINFCSSPHLQLHFLPTCIGSSVTLTDSNKQGRATIFESGPHYTFVCVWRAVSQSK